MFRSMLYVFDGNQRPMSFTGDWNGHHIAASASERIHSRTSYSGVVIVEALRNFSSNRRAFSKGKTEPMARAVGVGLA
jgi:hypothetical protein